MSKDSTLRAYDEIAPVYEDYSQSRMAYLNKVDDLVIAGLCPDMRLLDIGSGDGRRLSKICKQGGIRDIVAVEPSAGMAKICRERLQIDVHQVTGEQLSHLDIGTFDVITALWNVFGHIPGTESRLITLKNMAAKLGTEGRIMLDVNNRHNAMAYGRAKVLGRVIVDSLFFDERRGDATYEWKIGDKVFQGSGHLFTPSEIEKLFRQAGLKIMERLSVNYADGTVSRSPYQGQLFYILGRL